MRQLLILLLSTVSCCSSIKVLAYNTIYAHSHSSYIGKIADVLAEAGHDVTVLTAVVDPTLPNVTSSVARTVHIKRATEKLAGYTVEGDVSQIWTSPPDPQAAVGVFLQFSRGFAAQCESTLTDYELHKWLREEKFDVAYTEHIDQCGYFLFKLAGIEKYATAINLPALDGDSELTGSPAFPSYIPTVLSRFTDRMTFFERMQNAMAIGVNWWITGIVRGDMEIVRAKYAPQLPSSTAILKNSTYFFYNAEPLIEFPRISVSKIVSIGGITVDRRKAKPLDEYWTKVFDLRKRTVLLSFGTVMKSSLMPKNFKESLLAVFRAFPDVTFIWKYEVDDNTGEGIPNLVKSKWVPQFDMIMSGRVSLFMTHCGIASTMETLTAGVPMVVVPVIFDQFHNAKVVARTGSGIALAKTDIGNPQILIESLQKMLNTDKYRERAKFVSDMILNQPQTPQERLVGHFEFMAKFGPLRQLDHVSREMSYITYYLLDVIAFLAFIVISIISIVSFIVYKLLRLIFCRVIKTKKE